MSLFLTVDSLTPSIEKPSMFLLTILEFDPREPNFLCRIADRFKLEILNGHQSILMDFSFLENFSVSEFVNFKEKFQTGLAQGIQVRNFKKQSGVKVQGVLYYTQHKCLLLKGESFSSYQFHYWPIKINTKAIFPNN